ncbi:hypothetical protein CASFOL_028049 [Castilleja foliolosa]|uniref:SMP-LTD domain-containing protein n=1 Tax=Castilleja foliolosa TaxID=1961234 RepID=A0ABD3CGI7_9LAMI
MALLLLSAFIIGALTVVAAEAIGLWILIRRLNRKAERETTSSPQSVSSPGDLRPSLYDKQGAIWILVPDEVPKSDKGRILEVKPVRKYARIRDDHLILISDGSFVEILLRGCEIVAVSATSLPSRKWSKQYPIKVESKDSMSVYKGYKVIYIYLETSWEKESWCKALRLASCYDKEKITWFSKLNVEFHNYLASLNAGYPSFMKPSLSSDVELIDNSVYKLDRCSSKVGQLLKKFSKKGKANGVSTGVEGQLSRILDEGSLCFNMLISRLFFDVKDNLQIKSCIHNAIQRGLANMKIPSYMGEVSCTSVDLGSLPPHIISMRVLPSNVNELWSLEIDVEYLGAIVMELSTRLEIQELEDETENSKSTGQASSMLHCIGKQVSQEIKVPISLGMRVSSLSGTIQLCIKPPPSDRIWFGFTCMPEIQFNLEPFVGDNKITNGHLALFLISRFKAGIRETLVLPNRESVAIPWMLAEKDDWVPRNAAPFMWYTNNQDSTGNIQQEVTNLAVNYEIAQELGTASVKEDKPDIHMHSRSRTFTEGQQIDIQSLDNDESKLRRIGKRERMRGLGKKMGHKLEVKRRHLEEKRRSFVERIRAPSQNFHFSQYILQ